MLAAALVALAVAAPGSQAQDVPTEAVTALVRTVCDYQWLEAVCPAVGYPEPQYRTDEDPSPGSPLVQLVGAVHEHSAYSDGRWNSRPSDYFTAGRTGHNLADDGSDTGMVLDFMLSSDHTDNEKLPVTTSTDCLDVAAIPAGLAALDLTSILPPLRCSHVADADHYAKWNETLRQAIEGSDEDFTAMRGFEWTNDYFNHINVYFSRNTTNVKIDGGLLTLDVFWDWLRTPPEQGGGADGLITFNHPGGMPALTPFDGGLPHGELLQALKGGANWNDLAYVPDIDDRVAGIEVNGGDDLSWYVLGLTNGWHLGPVAAEDEHGTEWSSRADGKTLVLVRGRSPRDFYFAFRHHRTAAIRAELLSGVPGERAVVPTVLLWGGDQPMGSVLTGVASLDLSVELRGMPAGAPVVLVSSEAAAPIEVGTVGADGALVGTVTVTPPGGTEGWWFLVACRPTSTSCGTDEEYVAVTAPIWATASEAAPPVPTETPTTLAAAAATTGGTALPSTGAPAPLLAAAMASTAALLTGRNLRSARS